MLKQPAPTLHKTPAPKSPRALGTPSWFGMKRPRRFRFSAVGAATSAVNGRLAEKVEEIFADASPVQLIFAATICVLRLRAHALLASALAV
jgi:hypothetical protein